MAEVSELNGEIKEFDICRQTWDSSVGGGSGEEERRERRRETEVQPFSSAATTLLTRSDVLSPTAKGLWRKPT